MSTAPPLAVFDKLFVEKSDEYTKNPSQFLKDVFVYYEKNFEQGQNCLGGKYELVKVRAMVQDERGTEFVSLTCDIKQNDETYVATMLLRDSLDAGSGDIVAFNGQVGRHCYTMVEVPGATEWFLNTKVDDDTEVPTKRRCTIKQQSIPKFVAKFISDNAEEISPNTVLDLYGILSHHSLELDENEANTNLNNIPNLHVVHYETVNHKKLFPFVKNKDEMSTIGQVLLKKLEQIVGDDVSAEWLLTNLISTTYARPVGMPISFVPLNIVGVTDSQKIIDVLKSLLPQVKHLVLTPKLLSDVPFAPVKNYDKDILEHGELQLPNGTLLVIDETQLPQGSFPVSGHAENNLKVLERVILEQRMLFEYGFYQIPIDMDVPIIILSSKTSRFLKTPFRVPYLPGCPGSEVLGKENELELFRYYLQYTKASVKDIAISGDTTSAIQNDYVDMCKELDKNANKADLLNELLIVSRLMAAANGSEEVLFEHWARAIKMERSRKQVMEAWESVSR